MIAGDEFARVHAFVEGRVQGVGFRMFVYEHALKLGLTGWVRNTWDGEVELTVEGAKMDLERLLQEIRKGPRSAYVTNLRLEWQPYLAEFKRFEIRPTH